MWLPVVNSCYLKVGGICVFRATLRQIYACNGDNKGNDGKPIPYFRNGCNCMVTPREPQKTEGNKWKHRETHKNQGEGGKLQGKGW